MEKHTKNTITGVIHGAGVFTMFIFILAKCCHFIEADWAIILLLAFSPYILAGIIGILCIVLGFIITLFTPKRRE